MVNRPGMEDAGMIESYLIDVVVFLGLWTSLQRVGGEWRVYRFEGGRSGSRQEGTSSNSRTCTRWRWALM